MEYWNGVAIAVRNSITPIPQHSIAPKKSSPSRDYFVREQAHIQIRMSTSTETRNDRWPPQIKYIVGNEAAERFSFYGMRSILALYITTALLQSKDRATTVIHFFVFASYFMPLFGLPLLAFVAVDLFLAARQRRAVR